MAHIKKKKPKKKIKWGDACKSFRTMLCNSKYSHIIFIIISSHSTISLPLLFLSPTSAILYVFQ